MFVPTESGRKIVINNIALCCKPRKNNRLVRSLIDNTSLKHIHPCGIEDNGKNETAVMWSFTRVQDINVTISDTYSGMYLLEEAA